MVPSPIDLDAFSLVASRDASGRWRRRHSEMTRLETSRSTFAILVAAWALSGSALGQGQVPPKAPVAVNIPAAPADPKSAKAASGEPQPISPATPRVGPAPAGQVVADDYRIGPQDLIEIQVFGIDTLKREVRVNSRGRDLAAAGRRGDRRRASPARRPRR